MASSAPSLISTNANPRLRPVSRSVMTSALVTVPYWEKAVTRSSLVVWNAMFPTYSFLLTINPLLGHQARLGTRSRADEAHALPGVPAITSVPTRCIGCRNTGRAFPLRRNRLDDLGGREGLTQSEVAKKGRSASAA